MEDGRISFALVDQGRRIDYVNLLGLLQNGGCRGDVSCEVSGQLWSQEEYAPAQAAKTCYAHMAPAFKKAGVTRNKT